MGIYETFTKRVRRLTQTDQSDVYQYDELPQPFRIQVIHIWNSALGLPVENGLYTDAEPIWEFVCNTLCRELGVFHLGSSSRATPYGQCKNFLIETSTDGVLDIIEPTFRCIARSELADRRFSRASITQDAGNAVKELNHRFREHAIGYQFVEGEIIRVDSQYLHAEAVKPALSLLRVVGFQGASDEFLEAHEHYRKGESADAIADALKAFESTMKVICDSRGWSYSAGATAKTLTNIMLNNGLIPRFMETHLSGLRNTLEAGLPVVRNKLGGHGQGKEPREVPIYFAGYALHLAATNIVFLVEAHNSSN